MAGAGAALWLSSAQKQPEPWSHTSEPMKGDTAARPSWFDSAELGRHAARPAETPALLDLPAA